MKQLMVYSMTEAEIFDPALSKKAVEDIKGKGFDSIYLESRNTQTPYFAPRFQKAVSVIVNHCRKQGMKVVLDTTLNHFSKIMLDEHPEVFTESLVRQCAAVKGGTFTRELSSGDPSIWALEAAWKVSRTNRSKGLITQAIPVDAFTLASQVSEGGGCAMTRKKGQATSKQSWKVKGVASGTLFLVWRRRFNYGYRDLGHPLMAQYIDRILETAAQHDVAGVAWDEPHFGFDFLHRDYPITDRLYEVFRRQNGYDLKTRLIDLWEDVTGRDSAQVRQDFAEMLESQLTLLEQTFKQKALAHPRLGKRVKGFSIGIHRTMHEELSDDFWIGSVDYFRHNRGTTGGYTDCVFEREDSMLTFLVLARALAALSDSKEAWTNSWGFWPTDQHLAYYLRVTGALGVRWFGHDYHSTVMFGPGYPWHPTWKNMAGYLDAHRELFDAAEGAKATPDTAIVYHWQGMATFPGQTLQHHRRAILFAVQELLAARADVTIVSPEVLQQGSLKDGRWATALGSFKRILFVWPDRTTPATFDALEQAAAAGVEIMLAGPPAWHYADGTPCHDRWCALAGCAPVAKEAALAPRYGDTATVCGKPLIWDPAATTPNWQSNPEETYPDLIAWQLKALAPSTTTSVVTWDGHILGLRHGAVTAIAAEVAQIPRALTTLWPTETTIPKGLLAFSYVKDGKPLLLLVARHAKPVTATFRWNGKTVKLVKALSAILR
ncbi:MAG: hypothetical protein FWF84_00050 [Kiritimatiellaeota bacterium]|nr:hypothetical protein [Kiritimatiellota bacterium]